MIKEKEKIWSDLLLSNERSAALAVEIDEQTAEQDKIIKAKIEVHLFQSISSLCIKRLFRRLTWNTQEKSKHSKLQMKLRQRKGKIIF